MDIGEGITYEIIKNGERSNGGIRPQSEEEQAMAPAFWMPYIAAGSLDDAIGKIKELGGDTIMDPIEMDEDSKFVAARDPQGAFFSVWEGGMDD